MADSNNNASAADEQEQQVTFNVKSSSEAKYVVTVPLPSTVADLKQKLSTSEYANLPPERQRLIYSGRVLKDPDTIGSCKIKDGNTVHLVRGAESNSRQNPANQSGATVPGAGQPASNVPSNLAAGTSASNPLDQLTGARYAGFHGLPDMGMFGTDGGMGAPPNPDQMLRLLDDPNFASQMNEAMNNPAVVDMLRNNPMIRNNPIARQAIENPDFRRMMMNPDMIRMQMQMQRAMGGNGMGGAGESAFPMPGQTDTTPAGEGAATGGGTSATPAQTDTTGTPNTTAQAAANPFAALFPGAGGAGGADQNQANPFGSLFGQQQGGETGSNQNNNPLASMTQQLMQNPQMMQSMMQMMNGMNNPTATNNPSDPNTTSNTDSNNTQQQNPFGGFNPFAFGDMFGQGQQQQQPQQPADDRPPEVRYEDQLRQLNDMGFYEFERNVQALRRSGGSVQGAVEYLLSGGS
jgi:ubiquilin